jgi:hypothetical protein
MERLEESEDEEAIAGEGRVGWCNCYRLEEGDEYTCVNEGLNKG